MFWTGWRRRLEKRPASGRDGIRPGRAGRSEDSHRQEVVALGGGRSFGDIWASPVTRPCGIAGHMCTPQGGSISFEPSALAWGQLGTAPERISRSAPPREVSVRPSRPLRPLAVCLRSAAMTDKIGTTQQAATIDIGNDKTEAVGER